MMLKETVVERTQSLKPITPINQPRWIDTSQSRKSENLLCSNRAQIIDNYKRISPDTTLEYSIPQHLESPDENLEAILRDVDKINSDRISHMSLEEITQAQQEIMTMLPASFQNILKKKHISLAEPNMSSPQPKTVPLSSVQSNTQSDKPNSVERFDLAGCRVFTDEKQAIESLSTAIRETLALSNVYIDSSTSLIDSTSSENCGSNCEALVAALFEAAKQAGFITICGDSDALATVELFQHQYDPELPGYSLHEILELFRSDYSKQRILSSRILTGILRYRELIISLPSNNCDDLKMEEMNFDSTHRAVIRQFRTLCMAYDAICTTRMSQLRKCRDNDVLSYHETRDLFCRVCSKVLCASVLPPTLPSLLILDLKRASSGSASALQQQHLLQCLRSFLSSPVDEEHASLLWLGLWGQYGCPVLPIPHTIRPLALSYEQHMRQCKIKKCSFLHLEEDAVGGLDEVQEPSSLSTSSLDPSDVFALQCRWGRIDAMFQACEEFDTFNSVILVPLLNSLSCVSRALQRSSRGRSSGDIFASGDEELTILNGVSALEISVLVVKGGDSDLASLFSQKVLRKTVASYSIFLNTIMIRDGTAGLEADTKVIVFMYHAAWCRLLAEWARRFSKVDDIDSVIFRDIFENEYLWLVIASRISAYFRRVSNMEELPEGSDTRKTMDSIAPQSHEVVWMLRLWRVCICRGCVVAMSQAIVILHGPNAAAESIVTKASINKNSDMLRHITIAKTEFFCLLEQLSVSMQIFSTLSPEDGGFDRGEKLVLLLSLILDLAVKLIQQEFQHPTHVGSSPMSKLERASTFHFLSSILQMKKSSCTNSLDQLSQSPIKTLVDSVIANMAVRGTGCSVRTEHSSGGNINLEDKWLALEAVLTVSHESMSTELINLSTRQEYGSSDSSRISSWASEELSTAALRLLCNLAVDTALDVDVEAFFLSKRTNTIDKGPCVSQGLIVWQSHRLSQARVLIQVRYVSTLICRTIQSDGTASTPYLKTLKTFFEDFLLAFTDGPLGYILFLYLDLIRVEANLAYKDLKQWFEFKSYLIGNILKISYTDTSAEKGTIQTESQQSKFERFLLQDLSLMNGTRVASAPQYYPSALLDCPHTIRPAENIIGYSYDEEKIILQPLQRSFLFRMLVDQGLSGENLLLTLQLLLNIQRADNEQSVPITAHAISEKVFYLTSLTLIEHTNRWYAVAQQSQKHFEDYPAVVSEMPNVFVQLFASVLHQARLFCQSLEWSDRFALRDAFYSICAKEYFSMRKFLNRDKSTNASKNCAASGGSSCSSSISSSSSARGSHRGSEDNRKGAPNDSHAFEFCCQVISSGLNQSISSEVHSLVMAAIGLIPANALFPPRARDRLWVDIGQLRLVHLLEEHMQCFDQVELSYLLSWFPIKDCGSDHDRDVEEERNVDTLAINSMVRALATWRAQANAFVVNIMCFQVASAIFSLRWDSNGQLHLNPLVTGDRAKLIYSLTNRQSNPSWILEKAISILMLLKKEQLNPGLEESSIRSSKARSWLQICSENCEYLSKPMKLRGIREDPAALSLLESIQVADTSKFTGKQTNPAHASTRTSLLSLLESVLSEL